MLQQLDKLWKYELREPAVIQRKELSPCQEDLDVAHEILPGIYLGDKFGATDPGLLTQHGIRSILMLCARDEREEKWWFRRRKDAKYEEGWLEKGFVVEKIPAEDKMWYPLIPVHLEQVARFLDNQEHPVYVHCQAGASRSATLLTAYLMSKYQLSAGEALAFVQRKRPKVDPNANYKRQLEEWGRRLAPLSSAEEVEQTLRAWKGEQGVGQALQAKALLDELFEVHCRCLRQPGEEDWSSLKAMDAFKHDIMNCVFPEGSLQDLEQMLRTQRAEFPEEFPFLDAAFQDAILKVMTP